MTSAGLSSPLLTAVGDFIVISLGTRLKSCCMRITSPACDTAADQDYFTFTSGQIHCYVVIYLGFYFSSKCPDQCIALTYLLIRLS